MAVVFAGKDLSPMHSFFDVQKYYNYLCVHMFSLPEWELLQKTFGENTGCLKKKNLILKKKTLYFQKVTFYLRNYLELTKETTYKESRLQFWGLEDAPSSK